MPESGSLAGRILTRVVALAVLILAPLPAPAQTPEAPGGRVPGGPGAALPLTPPDPKPSPRPHAPPEAAAAGQQTNGQPGAQAQPGPLPPAMTPAASGAAAGPAAPASPEAPATGAAAGAAAGAPAPGRTEAPAAAGQPAAPVEPAQAAGAAPLTAPPAAAPGAAPAPAGPGGPPEGPGAPTAVPAEAARRTPAGSEANTIEMNFRNVDILSFVQIMSQAMNIPMAWDEREIKGKITVISPRRFSRADAMKIFETVLDMQGYTVLRREGSPLVQIVTAKDAARYPSPTVTERTKGPVPEGFVTQIIPLRYADANQVRAALQQIQSKTAAIAVYTPGNLLIASDSQENVQHLLSIIHELDIEPGEMKVQVIRLKYGSTRVLAPLLTSLFASRRGQPGQAPAAGQPELRIVSDERTNSLIVSGDEFAISKMRELLESLDVPGVAQNLGVRVFKLQYADADELTKVLRDVRLSPNIGPLSGAGGAAAPGAPPPPAAPGAAGGGTGSGTGITSDKPSNSLVVFGSPDFIQAVEEIVTRLDVRRPQVFVQVLIMEMSLNKSLTLGVRWQASSPVGSNVIGAGNPGAAPLALTDAIAAGQGAAIGIIGNQITFNGQSYASFAGFIQATRQDQDLNVLANPQLLTLNNEEAQINISQVIPVSAKILTNVNNQTTTEFEFKDVGIILKITPQITGENKVRLVIDQESSSVASQQSTTSLNQNAITTLKRKLTTKVLVDDASVMAIGGLIQDQNVVSVTKVPCLGDVPLLGYFFKSRTESVQKTNLIVFIRPQIIHTQQEGETTTRAASSLYEETKGVRTDTEERVRRTMDLPPAAAPAPLGPPASR